ncbi:MAG: deoxynucleoside kinase [Nanoarchaeota archaeon]|nr:deoxynucleoside kinase [Nanoarchaeota archaeon]MBU1321201.1 deoxynucleoside kinase [Nanoarchaeota archaeon]MBU1597006.1 deoxynucleoside kinase [Nanoarchaeota archaeon]MBU2441848.1 deoxynucleoside kinase [Nanoarchaeota archaeon]
MGINNQNKRNKGKFIIIDGPDCSGKGILFDGLQKYALEKGKKIFDLEEYTKKHEFFPEPEELFEYDIIFSSEPTYVGIGKVLREEIIKHNSRHYSAFDTALFYSLDRMILYRRLIIPLLEKGKLIIQGRGITSSVAYQPIQAEPLELDIVLGFEGNNLAIQHAPDLLVILDAKPEFVMDRMKKRKKQDQSIFDKYEFQKNLYERYMSDWFKKLFEEHGSKVVYLDMNRTEEQEIADAINIVAPYIGRK